VKKAIIVGAVVIGAIVVLALFLPALMLDAGTSTGMDITFYDADGNELGTATSTGFFGLGIQGVGFEGDIDHLTVRVSFLVTTNIEYREMYTYCYLEVVTAINDVQHGDVVHTVAEHQMDTGKTGLEGTFEATYQMSTLLPDSAIDVYGKTYGWIMSFNARVRADLDLDDGTQRSAEDTCSMALTLVWVDTEIKEEIVLESWIGIP
jgi:hypothetical protein